jgi:hypothetical protein
MARPVVLVTAPVATRSGYGAHARDIVRSLIKIDKYDIKIMPVRWGSTPQNALTKDDPNDQPIIDRLLQNPQLNRQPEIHIHIVVPNEFQPFAKYNIGITAGIETTACVAEWLEGMNRMNLNIVPSKFTKEVLEKTIYDKNDEKTGKTISQLKCEKPIEVLFEGTDTNIYKTTNKFSELMVEEFKNIKETFVFLFVGHWLQGELGQDRKDAGMLIKTFLETFKNKSKQPALLLKTSGATPSIIDREEILNKINKIKETTNGKLPPIYLIHGDLTDEQMNELYNHPKVKAHISFTKGEGFGRPLLEATMSEKPLIVSDWSGHKDFLSKDLSVLLPGELTEVHSSSIPDNMRVAGSQWFTVNYSYASKVLKDVYKNYKRYVSNAKKLTIVNKSKFSLNAMTKELEKILDKYIPEFPEEVKLKLPKLKKVGDKTELPKIKLPKLKKV